MPHDCPICFESKPVLFGPIDSEPNHACMHRLCTSCWKKLRRLTCPTCRHDISDWWKLNFPRLPVPVNETEEYIDDDFVDHVVYEFEEQQTQELTFHDQAVTFQRSIIDNMFNALYQNDLNTAYLAAQEYETLVNDQQVLDRINHEIERIVQSGSLESFLCMEMFLAGGINLHPENKNLLSIAVNSGNLNTVKRLLAEECKRGRYDFTDDLLVAVVTCKIKDIVRAVCSTGRFNVNEEAFLDLVNNNNDNIRASCLRIITNSLVHFRYIEKGSLGKEFCKDKYADALLFEKVFGSFINDDTSYVEDVGKEDLKSLIRSNRTQLLRNVLKGVEPFVVHDDEEVFQFAVKEGNHDACRAIVESECYIGNIDIHENDDYALKILIRKNGTFRNTNIATMLRIMGKTHGEFPEEFWSLTERKRIYQEFRESLETQNL